MMHDIPHLNAAQLRGFSIKLAAVIGPLFGLVLPWLFNLGFPVWPWAVAAILLFWGLLAPATLGPLYRGWMTTGLGIGWVNSHIILSLVFYLLLMPMGLIMRLLGRDPMARKLDPNQPSYRSSSRKPTHRHMERPY